MYRILLAAVLSLLAVVVNCSADAESLHLNQEEQSWLQEHRTIRMSGPQALPPFQYLDSDGSFVGMASDYMEAIAELAGFQVEVVSGIPWTEILDKIEHREIDVLSCAASTPEREGYLLFTSPHITFPLIIVSKKDSPFISGIESLHGKRVAFVKNTITRQMLEGKHIDFVPHVVATPLDALREVSLGHADVTIENLAVATYLIERNGLVNLKIAAPTSLEKYALSIAVRKDWPEMASIINKGLAALPPEKKDAIKQRWIMAMRYEHGISSWDVTKWGGLIGAICLGGILLFYLWNRQLAKEIDERKRAEQAKEELIEELRKALDEVKTLRGILPICSNCMKIRDDKGYWTQLEEYIGQHSEADFSHGICPDCLEKLYGQEKWFANAKDQLSVHRG